MFYLLIVPVYIMTFYMFFHLLKIKKHDKVLYKFCEVRRDIMAILRKENFNLPKDDYLALRRLLMVLNDSIHYYDDHKTGLFNIRKFFKFLDKFKEQLTQVDNFEIPQKPEIINLYKDFTLTMLLAFFTFTPLLKYEFFLNFLMYISKALIKHGKNQFQNYLEAFTIASNKNKEFQFC